MKMIQLDRLRDSSLILDGFESIILDWIERVPKGKQYADNREFHYEEDVPDLLQQYWSLAKRYRQLPLAGCRGGVKLLLCPEIFSTNHASEDLRYPGDWDPGVPDVYMKLFSGSFCSCCFGGFRFSRDARQWKRVTLEDWAVRATRTDCFSEFLIPYGLFHLSSSWIHEEGSMDFSPIREEARTLWRGEDFWAKATCTYWVRDDGIIGKTIEHSDGSHSSSIAAPDPRLARKIAARCSGK